MLFQRSLLFAFGMVVMGISTVGCAGAPGIVLRPPLAVVQMRDSRAPLPIDERPLECHDLFSGRFSVAHQ
jgi:hypothetical protein